MHVGRNTQPEHNVGHLYVAKPALRTHYEKLDPIIVLMWCGQTSKLKALAVKRALV